MLEVPVQVFGPDLLSSSSDYLAKSIVVSGSGGHAIEVVGGAPDFDSFDLSGSTDTGLRLRQYADVDGSEKMKELLL